MAGSRRRSTLDGIAVTHGATLLTFVAQVPYTAAVSRLLAPSEFGLVALAGVLLRFASYFASAGIVTALIQRTEITRDDLRAALTLSILASTVCCVAIMVAAPRMADLFGNPGASAVTRVLSLSLVLGAMGNPAVALLRRAARFRELAVIDLVSYVFAYPVVGIAMAVLGFGVWSLVGAALVQAAIVSGLAMFLARSPVRLSRSLSGMGSIARFGGGVSAVGLLEFLSSNTDTFAVARYSGTEALGQYSRGSLLFGLPMYYFTNNTVKVVFPRFARDKGDRLSLFEIYQRAMVVICGLLAPFCVLVCFVSRSLVAIVLGPGWELAASLVPFVTIAVAVDLASHMPGALYEAMGRLRLRIAVQLVHLGSIIALVSLVISRRGSVKSLAIVWIIGQCVRHAAFLLSLPSVLTVRSVMLARPYVEAAYLAVAMFLGGFVGSRTGGNTMLGNLVLPVTLGCASMLLAIRLVPSLLLRRELLALPFGSRLGPLLGRR